MWFVMAMISVVSENLILTNALGTSTLMAASKSHFNLLLLSALITIFSVLGCIVTGAAESVFHLSSSDAGRYFLPLVYAAAVAVIYLTMLVAARAALGKTFQKIKKYIHLSAFNCAVTGTLYLNYEVSARRIFSPGVSGWTAFGLQTGAGFLLVSLMLSAVRKRLHSDEVPEIFRGMPAVMVYLGLLSLAVYTLTI